MLVGFANTGRDASRGAADELLGGDRRDDRPRSHVLWRHSRGARQNRAYPFSSMFLPFQYHLLDHIPQ